MFEMKQRFKDLPNTMVLTTKDVLEKQNSILFVSNDADDGMWQFHNSSDVDMDNAMVVALEEIVQFDPAITSIADLRVAWRDDTTKPWNREKFTKLYFESR